MQMTTIARVDAGGNLFTMAKLSTIEGRNAGF